MYIAIGIFGAPYGVRGYVKLKSFTRPSNNVFNYTDVVFSDEEGIYKPVCVRKVKTTAKGAFIVSVDNIQDRNEVSMLTNKKLFTERRNFPKLNENEFYHCDIIGMNVVSLQNRNYGSVVDVIETGSNDVFVISGEKKILVPYIDIAVVGIDAKKRIITINPDFAIDN